MKFTRRRFFGATAVSVASAAALGTRFAWGQEGTSRSSKLPSKLYKGQIVGAPTDPLCETLKTAGFEGLEVSNWNVSVPEARKCRLLAEKHDMRIHSVMRGWTNFNQADQFDADIKSVVTALESASAYGADAILLVPCRIGGMVETVIKMPDPWDFDIDFDAKTLQVKSVADGDNSPYTEYIAAQNLATEQTIRAVEMLIPTAAKVGVRIAIENVWNNLWCSPEYFAALCKYFDNPWVGAYFDLGNHTKYARCEEWLQALGHSIVKLHIKGYKVSEVRGKRGGGLGDWCAVDEASIDWKAVRKLLKDIRYNGWVTVEEKKYDDAKYCEILDAFFDAL